MAVRGEPHSPPRTSPPPPDPTPDLLFMPEHVNPCASTSLGALRSLVSVNAAAPPARRFLLLDRGTCDRRKDGGMGLF